MLLTRDQLRKKVVSPLLEGNNTFATVLHIILLVMYGEDIYTVDPIELYMRLEEDFNCKLDETNENKIQAILIATKTDLFHQDPEVFHTVCNTLTEGDPGITMMDPVTLPEAVWGMFEVEANHGEADVAPAVDVVLEEIMESDLDDADLANPYAHVQGFMEERHALFKDQLTRIGVDPLLVPPLPQPDHLSHA